jgi:hypothetical protein
VGDLVLSITSCPQRSKKERKTKEQLAEKHINRSWEKSWKELRPIVRDRWKWKELVDNLRSWWNDGLYYNFLSYNLYFRKFFKLVHRKNMVIVTFDFRYVSPFHLHWVLGVGNFTKWSACAQTAYEVVRVCTDRLWSGLRVHRPPMKWSACAKTAYEVVRVCTDSLWSGPRVHIPPMKWSACAQTAYEVVRECTAYEVVRDCRKLEKHCTRARALVGCCISCSGW